MVSTAKYTEADLLTVFDKHKVNVYDLNNTTFTVSRGAITRGWFDKNSGLWKISFTANGYNARTITVNKPPSQLLTERQPNLVYVTNV